MLSDKLLLLRHHKLQVWDLGQKLDKMTGDKTKVLVVVQNQLRFQILPNIHVQDVQDTILEHQKPARVLTRCAGDVKMWAIFKRFMTSQIHTIDSLLSTLWASICGVIGR